MNPALPNAKVLNYLRKGWVNPALANNKRLNNSRSGRILYKKGRAG